MKNRKTLEQEAATIVRLTRRIEALSLKCDTIKDRVAREVKIGKHDLGRWWVLKFRVKSAVIPRHVRKSYTALKVTQKDKA